jgi:hypothetical protein
MEARPQGSRPTRVRIPYAPLALAFFPDGGDSREDAAMNVRDLHERIESLGGQDAYPVVSLDLFFEGNDDPASFAPNLEPHPGIDTFSSVLRSIRDRPDVSGVVVQIDEVLGSDDWPYASAVYVITSAPAGDVHEWASELQPDEDPSPGNVESYGWVPYAGRDRATPPPGAPEIPPGQRVVTLFWD